MRYPVSNAAGKLLSAACLFLCFLPISIMAQGNTSRYYQEAQQWWAQGRSLEQSNKLREAFDAYSKTISSANMAVQDASQRRSRAFAETCLRGFAGLDMARMYYALGGQMEQVNNNLAAAEQDLKYTLTNQIYRYPNLFRSELQSQSQPWAIYNALGYIHLMKNDPEQAHRAFQQAYQLNPEFKPAADALFMVEQYRNGARQTVTPNGTQMPRITTEQVKTAVKEIRPFVSLILRAIAKRYGFVATLGVDLVDLWAAQNGM